LELINPGSADLALMALTVFGAYTVLGFSGFGAILVALPILSHLLSLKVALPVLLVSDLLTAGLLGLKGRALVSRPELLRLLPFAAAGMVVGVLLLQRGSERVLLTGLGCFVIAMALWNLLGRASTQPVSARWAVPAGLVGGTFSSMFGTGGPVYTLFLARRLRDTAVLRATVGAVVLVSAVVRLGLFTTSGFFKPAGLLQLALTLLPFSVAGYLLGSRIQARVPQDKVRRVIWMLLVASGASVLWRGLHVAA
jgi:uncharacterized protein